MDPADAARTQLYISIANAIFSFALVIVTTVYAWLTWKTNRDLVTFQSRVSLTCEIHKSESGHRLCIRNEGPGTAFNINCFILMGERTHNIPPFALSPNNERCVSSELLNPIQVAARAEPIRVQLEWSDVLNRRYHSTHAYRWNSMTADFVAGEE